MPDHPPVPGRPPVVTIYESVDAHPIARRLYLLAGPPTVAPRAGESIFGIYHTVAYVDDETGAVIVYHRLTRPARRLLPAAIP